MSTALQKQATETPTPTITVSPVALEPAETVTDQTDKGANAKPSGKHSKAGPSAQTNNDESRNFDAGDYEEGSSLPTSSVIDVEYTNNPYKNFLYEDVRKAIKSRNLVVLVGSKKINMPTEHDSNETNLLAGHDYIEVDLLADYYYQDTENIYLLGECE
ncbi:hypothetical protein BC937DRAFT_93436 [Endogone sp. FLAS-F59071]|nr:hypothetical protein BC937DRAFT_93436 [Endogone sp. FLAS-F59071]|eukprot:RUS14714.1 hypothetical protein BC937DRAFT_93436 [Endogone sp. FLAS-F59071]